MANNLSSFGKLWSALKSPKVVSILKLGVAVIGVIHAVEEIVAAAKDSNTEAEE